MNPFKKTTKQLSIFLTAGYPYIDSLTSQLDLLEAYPIDFVEVGIPFSDPLADGPIIQKTSKTALNNGMNLKLLFEQLASRTSKTPLVLMGYLNPIISFGLQLFLKSCKLVGISSVIITDMSLEIYDRFYRSYFDKYSVSPCFLITPKSSPKRIKKISDRCQNSFVYLVSSNAITGSRISFGDEQASTYKAVRKICADTPLFIGFGIDSYEKVKFVQSLSDGAIIGSAYLKALSVNRHHEFLEQFK
tara:strand:- start:5511 stop:6248 length:738 start_codon:yes stop_codon:yes gene_type:complete